MDSVNHVTKCWKVTLKKHPRCIEIIRELKMQFCGAYYLKLVTENYLKALWPKVFIALLKRNHN